MKRSFYYAELDLTVILEEGSPGILMDFSQYDDQALSILVHSAITDFLLLRAVFSADATEYAKRIEQARPKDTDIIGGG